MIEEPAAIEIARLRAAENGLAFAKPISVRHRRGWFGQSDRYEIETDANGLGNKARFVIDASTGAVVSEGYIAR